MPTFPKINRDVNPRPMGVLAVERQKDAFIAKAEPHGWAVTNRDPLTLAKAEREIVIEFNSAGMPKGASWPKGDEFEDMASSGRFHRDALEFWFAWEPKNDEEESEKPDAEETGESTETEKSEETEKSADE